MAKDFANAYPGASAAMLPVLRKGAAHEFGILMN